MGSEKITKIEKIVNLLIEDGYPEDLINRYIKACKKNYANDNTIIKALNDRLIPDDMKNNQKVIDLSIEAFRDAIELQERMEILPIK